MKLNIIKRMKKKEKEKENVNIKVPSVDNSTLLNIENLKNSLGNSEDIKYKDIVLNNNKDMLVNLIYIDGLVSQTDISDYILKPLIQNNKISEAQNIDEVIKLVQEGALYFSTQIETKDLNLVIDSLTSASSVLLFSGQNTAFIFDTKGFEKRPMMEPTVENVSKGPKDSFIENYRTNTATIRRKIKTPDLMIENFVIGKQTHTSIAIVYIKSIMNDEILQQIRDRLGSINTDNLLSTSIIEDALSDNIHCVFPHVLSTERPDKFCADVVEGRAGIIVDGIPFGFIVPGTFIQFLQTPEDYSRKYIISSIIRLMRIFSPIISLVLPALYISITTFHPEMMPTNLALFIAKSREGVALPVAIETLAMLLAFEILYEAGLRVPRTIGQAVSIVGTLVVGQAAVEAKLVSPSVVVVVALTSIASFTMPNQDLNNAIRLWRFVLAIFGTLLGLVGVVMSFIILTFKLCELESFGISYMSPFVASEGKDIIEDTFLRLPLKDNKTRPIALKIKNVKRQGD